MPNWDGIEDVSSKPLLVWYVLLPLFPYKSKPKLMEPISTTTTCAGYLVSRKRMIGNHFVRLTAWLSMMQMVSTLVVGHDLHDGGGRNESLVF